MEEIKIYNTKDLVLRVDKNFDPSILELDKWESFIDKLCENRDYQKEAIRNTIIYLASNRYSSIEDLIKENFEINKKLGEKYKNIEEYLSSLQLPRKLYGTIDLATGTGKSYVIYGIAQIMLGLGLVDKVLVLCPSLTIESGLKTKFEELSGSSKLKSSIPEDAIIKNPRIIGADVTIKDGDICIENIHAIYEKTSSSIQDSLKSQGERILVLNDEVHHVFNKVTGKDLVSQNIKKWKEFLLTQEYSFKFIMGFTGTAYVENEYFNDVIYRYSLRSAIENRVVKNIEYIQKDDSDDTREKFEKIYANHKENVEKYSLIKPITILITQDIKKAKALGDDLLKFLSEKQGCEKEEIEKVEKILIVTSSSEHKPNLMKLKTVDQSSNSYEWIISVSMLTEGWDVKNVFQIVPWEDRAFNSKLLIAQVLGRGLRIPPEYMIPQPKVTIFNHDSWSKNIRKLVDEVLEIETKITSEVLTIGERSKYNFHVFNLVYDKDEVAVIHEKEKEIFDYTRIKYEGIKLESQVEKKDKSTTYKAVFGNSIVDKIYVIQENTYSVDEILEKIYDEFSIREWEGRVLKLDDKEYTKNNLPPIVEMKDIIINSMRKVGIEKDLLVEKNRNRILQAFGTLLRKKGKTITTKLRIESEVTIDTKEMNKHSCSIGNFRSGSDSAIFYSTNYKKELAEKDLEIMGKMISENEDSVSEQFVLKEVNVYQFRTPLSSVFINGNPEKRFVVSLIKHYDMIDGWVKSRDLGFYSIEYSWRKGEHQIQGSFNPDFFIKVTKEDIEYIIVVETKADKDNSDENKAKYKYGLDHFERLNSVLESKNIKQKYIFHFLSPSDYTEFFEYIKNGKIFLGQFRCGLETLLEEHI